MDLKQEEERLAALAAYEVLDTPAEAAFDDITKLAAEVCDVPIALVSLVDRQRQWFKSCVGLGVRETSRAVAFCAHAIQAAEPFVVADTHEDGRFVDNPLVVGPPHIRFYAGVPLVDQSGSALGTLCVVDTRPRQLSVMQTNTLVVLAKQVVAQLRLRRALREQAEQLARQKSLSAELERAHRLASFVAEGGKLLSASLETERTLEAVARLLVPNLADMCSIVVCDEGGSLRRVAKSSGVPDALDALLEIRESAASQLALSAIHLAIAEKQTIKIDGYPRWLAERVGADHPYVRSLESVGIESALVAPMVLGGRVLGAVNVGAHGGRSFGEYDVVALTELAARAAVALENARLFSEAQAERARAEKANDLKDDFLAAISHDLRTPLNAVLGWTQMIRRKPDDVALVGRATDVIERSVRTQTRLVEDLLDISRISAGRFHVEREPVNMFAIVEAALEALRPNAEACNVTIATHLDTEAMHVLGDFERLQQVVSNLVSNAIKFSRTGGVVEVRLEREDEYGKLTVLDDGRGISPELLPHVFERFRQDGDGVGRRLGGLGLGLAIAKHIVESVAGEIRAHSAGEGKGATFFARIPLAPSIPTSTPALSNSRESSIDESSLSGLRGVRVLVVDDAASTRSLLSELLDAHGMNVSTAASAEEGFEAFTKRRPDLLVSDVMMGGASGYDLMRKIRDLPVQDGGRTPSLALTGSTGALDRTRAISAGFDFYVPKPIEASELLAVLAALHARAR